MSNAAVFMLIANDGRADQMIMASALLHARIDDIRGLRESMGHDDINPTLADIERTHILFMNATFKPFAAFGFEYQRVQPSGSVNWSSNWTYSIPQSGDFFADMGILFSMSAATYGGAVVTPGASVSTTGQFLAADSTATPLIRYCDYPGERIVEKASFSVNTNPLHEYDWVVTSFRRKFKMPATKKLAYDRLCGQEVPRPAQGVTTGDAAGTLLNNGNAVGDFATTLMPGGSTSVGKTTAHRVKVDVLNGLQTPKSSQPAATFWHKCSFWFNQDPRLMVPSVAIPYGQRFVSITSCKQSALMRVVGGISSDTTLGAVARDTTHYSRSFAVAGSQSGGWGDAASAVRLTAINAIAAAANKETITGGAILSADLYVNNVYVLPDIHDIYIHRIGFNLIRINRVQVSAVTANSTAEVLLQNLKWPIEALYFGVQSTRCANDLDCWWRMGDMLHELSAGWAALDDGGNTNIATTQPYHFLSDSARTMTGISISLHGTKVYDAMDASFFSDYMPATYGGSAISCTDDQNSHAVFFGFYPGTYQPSGHVNISRARELYFKWTQSAVDGTFYAVADAINFLLISDGNAILRYTT